ncbi:hypothetical protein [Paracoccus sp. ME4]|uniref:hypothetical protein n=1 Tax=Paracoccus sp. ME4 TaxID=3138066 RepID=UPI00398B0852
MTISPSAQRPACVRCQTMPAADLTRQGDLFYGGYDSDYDLQCFAAIREADCPQGDICNGCMKALLDGGAVIRVRTLGKLEPRLPAEAHAALFRGAREFMVRLLDRSRSPDDLLLRAYPAREHDPVSAGMLAALLQRNGMEMDGADLRYGKAIQAEDDLLAAMLNQVEEAIDGAG